MAAQPITALTLDMSDAGAATFVGSSFFRRYYYDAGKASAGALLLAVGDGRLFPKRNSYGALRLLEMSLFMM
jgi:hypothetical protein